ncbi:probable cytochrome P450 6d5 [Drosophila gunungcola]|uniref:probable cytochrome P450 6d5 n=1 Tax=Drosophila gunungcola TaxID=103775 RepID=UPI0022DED640|nr:probable cytochrome P450 6d5 [Drosophila gunungcola]
MIGIYLLISAVTLLFVYLKWTFSYWDRKGFPSTGVSIPFGALESVTKGKRSFGLAIHDLYQSTREPVVGMYLTVRPALLVRDAQLAHDVLVKDFASFHDRGVYVDEKNDPMSANLFAMEGASWRALRNKLTPSFTSGKLKAMFETSNSVGDKLIANIKAQLPETGIKELDIKSLTSTYAIDIIASTIFGLDVDSFADPNNEFFAISKKLNRNTFQDIVRGATSFLYPGLEKFFVKIGWKQEAFERMRELSNRTVDLREKNNLVRRDLLQLLLQLRNQGKINTDDSVWSAESTKNGVKSMSKDLVAGQLLLFYAAGFETTASTTSFTLYELTQNPEVMAKAKEDVRSAIEKNGGTLNYDAISDMKYLEACVLETARKYPALPLLNRICTQDYPVPDSKLVIKKGTQIIISLLGLHHDEDNFPDPLSYQPERYLEDNKNYNQAAYLPFGEGPRMCIGARMGKVNVKIAIAKVLSNFDLEICKEKREIEFGIHGVTLMPKNGIPIRFSLKK